MEPQDDQARPGLVTTTAGRGPAGIEIPDRVRELAERLGHDDRALPAYVYDLEGLAEHVASIRAAIPDGVEVFYAVKANPDPAVLRVIARLVDGLEVSSGGEVEHVSAAVPGCRLSFGGPGKTSAELTAAVQAGTSRFLVESPHELRLLGSAAMAAQRSVDVLLRVNLPAADAAPASLTPETGTGLVMGGRPSPFGMDPALLDGCAEFLSAGGIASGRLRLRGLHAHLASGLEAPALLNSAARVLDFAREWCGRHGLPRPEINLGGGMAVNYRRPKEVFDWAEYGRGLALAVRQGETLRIEPGRAVTAYCGWYVTRVLDVKRSHGEAFAVVAGGTHHLRTPAAKGHSQPFAVIPVAPWAQDWTRPSMAEEHVTIVGQLCTPKDILARDVSVARLRAGDLVAFGLTGAYAWNISHHGFLMHPQPGFHHVGTCYARSLGDVAADQVPDHEGHAGRHECRGELAQASHQHRPPGQLRYGGAAYDSGRPRQHQSRFKHRESEQEGAQRDQCADREGRERRSRSGTRRRQVIRVDPQFLAHMRLDGPVLVGRYLPYDRLRQVRRDPLIDEYLGQPFELPCGVTGVLLSL